MRPADAEPQRAGASEPAIQLIALERRHDRTWDVSSLCRAAELALTAGLISDAEEERVQWFRRGEAYAREAHAIRPDAPEAMFLVAAAVGLAADHASGRERVRMANEVLEYSDRILSVDPGHPGGLHLRGQLGAAAMRLNPMVRFVVERVLGGETLSGASWEGAESDFRKAIAGEPDNPIHRLELATLLRDTGREEEARDQLRRVLLTTGDDALTEYYRERARLLLAEMD